jgi:hypothetical protein
MDPEKLHAAADQLNAAIEAFEDELRQQRFAVRASVPLDGEHPLVFMKQGGQFRLVVGDQLLVSCSRTVRLKAVAVFDQVHPALLEATQAELNRVQDAIAATQALTARLRGLR